MLSDISHTPSGSERFRLVKYFAIACFFVMVIFSFPFSMFIAQKAKDTITKSYENYALLLGQNLNHQVLQNYMLPAISMYGQLALRDRKQQEMMDRVVRDTIHGFQIELVNIYSHDQGVIAYSTNPNLIGKEAEESPGYLKALKGDVSSGLISEGGFFWDLVFGRTQHEQKIRTYIPFRGFNPFAREEDVFGIFEFVQDMTDQYTSIVKFQYLVFGLSILIMTFIFIALILIVRKAELIIEDRARQQRTLQEQLHLSERLAAVGEMVAGVSHEIKNPLGIIQSTAELLNGMTDSKETQKQLASVIHEEASRLNRIVTEFLDFARPHTLHLQVCHLDQIIRKNIAFLTTEFEKWSISVDDNLEERSMRIEADLDLLYRAFLNIFINAIQSMHDSATRSLSIRVQELKGLYSIHIIDTGQGIDPDHRKKIFHPFFTTKEQGSGLGLPIVKKIIEAHGGIIRIEDGGHSGTTVTIVLPRKQ